MRSQLAKSKAHNLGLFTAIEASSELLDKLAIATSAPKKADFTISLITQIPDAFGHHNKQPEQLFDLLLTWFGNYKEHHSRFKAINTAITFRRTWLQLQRNRKVRFMRSIGLTWGPSDRDQFISSIRQVHLPRLAKPYPPKDHWIIETSEINDKWQSHIELGKQPDKRLKRYKIFHLDPTQLQLDIEATKSVLIYDSNGTLVMAVIRNFSNNTALLNTIDNIIKRAIDHRKSIRLEDPGKLVQIGYSAGARSKPAFHWVKNILSQRTSPHKVDALDREISHALSLMWMLFRKKLPETITADILTWMAETGIPRMNKEVLKGEGGDIGEIELDIGENMFVLSSAEFAPPSGVMAANYSRPVHMERQPHKYAISWTTARSLPDNGGGHFYNSSYGVRVKGHADTAVAWMPTDWHGTSLQDYNPTTQIISDFNQTGLALVTPNRISKVWKRYENSLSFKEANVEWAAEIDSD